MPTNALHEALSRVDPAPTVAVIRPLIDQNPGFLMEKEDRHGRTPLFLALVGPLPLDIVQALIDACPDAVLERDADGDLPIQYTLWRGYRAECARAMIKANPAGLELRDLEDEFPLHVAVQFDADVETFNLILQGYPEACKMQDEDNRIPLECALFRREDDYGYIDVDLRTPLHALLRKTTGNQALEVAKVLARARPDVLSLKDDGHGDIPLATALRHGADVTTVQWLINAQPVSIEAANKHLQIPLHIAVSRRGTSLEIVRVLYHAWPDSVKQSDWGGRLALALAAGNAPQETVDLLLAAFPEAARSKDNQGKIPLHYTACLSSMTLVSCLADAWPGGTKEPDALGNVALFLAFQQVLFFDQRLASLLLEAWPDSVSFANHNGDLPIHGASRVCFDGTPWNLPSRLTHVRCLVDAWPESLLEKNREGKLSLHLLLESMGNVESVSRKRKRDGSTVNYQSEMVRLFVSKCPESVEVADADGSVPLFVACKNDALSLDDIDFLLKASISVLISNRIETLASSTAES